MSRQAIARSCLGILAPICFLVLAAKVDWIFHHAPPRLAPARAAAPARPAPCVHAALEPALPPVASAEPPTALDLMHEIRRACPNPDRADGCSPATLTAALANDLPAIRAHYHTIEERYIARLASSEYLPIHALGFLRSRRALPVLSELLFMAESDADWLAPPNEPSIFYADRQFPRHRALLQAIESIEGLPIRRAFKLTRAEHRQLSSTAAACHRSTTAQWLLHELDGTPLPTFGEIRAHHAACHARVIGG